MRRDTPNNPNSAGATKNRAAGSGVDKVEALMVSKVVPPAWVEKWNTASGVA